MAEKVRAGSVPMATATSILPEGRVPEASTEPPEERAMMSTAADFPLNPREGLGGAHSAVELAVRR